MSNDFDVPLDAAYAAMAEDKEREAEALAASEALLLDTEEKLSALKTVEYLQERAERGIRAKYEAVLAKVRDVEPADYDRL